MRGWGGVAFAGSPPMDDPIEDHFGLAESADPNLRLRIAVCGDVRRRFVDRREPTHASLNV